MVNTSQDVSLVTTTTLSPSCTMPNCFAYWMAIAGRFTLGTCMSISSMWIGWTPLCSISCLATLALGQNANIGIFGRYAEISRGCTRNIMVNKRSKKDVK